MYKRLKIIPKEKIPYFQGVYEEILRDLISKQEERNAKKPRVYR